MSRSLPCSAAETNKNQQTEEWTEGRYGREGGMLREGTSTRESKMNGMENTISRKVVEQYELFYEQTPGVKY